MGQGYKAIILASQKDNGKEIIRTWVDTENYNNGYKLMEHSYVGNNFVDAVEYLLSPMGMFYKSRVVWAGDYADKEEGLTENLYELAEEGKVAPQGVRRDMRDYLYIVNHTKMQYTAKIFGRYIAHPLPLLTAEGNGRGGGDYNGTHDELVGTWARDVISVEIHVPEGYEELVCNFYAE